jgi:hypothetical protein
MMLDVGCWVLGVVLNVSVSTMITDHINSLIISISGSDFFAPPLAGPYIPLDLVIHSGLEEILNANFFPGCDNAFNIP